MWVYNARKFGVPYGNRTRVAAVKEKRFTGIQRKLAAWIAPQGSQRNSKDSLMDPNGLAIDFGGDA
jgi:hypothetical protein